MNELQHHQARLLVAGAKRDVRKARKAVADDRMWLVPVYVGAATRLAGALVGLLREAT